MSVTYIRHEKSNPVTINRAKYEVHIPYFLRGDGLLKYVSEEGVKKYLEPIAQEFRSAFSRAATEDKGTIQKLARQYSADAHKFVNDTLNNSYGDVKINGKNYQSFDHYADDAVTLAGIRPAVEFLAAVGDALQKRALTPEEQQKWQPIVKNIVKNKVVRADHPLIFKFLQTARGMAAEERRKKVEPQLYITEPPATESAPTDSPVLT